MYIESGWWCRYANSETTSSFWSCKIVSGAREMMALWMAAQLVHWTIPYSDLGVQWAKLRSLHISSIGPSDGRKYWYCCRIQVCEIRWLLLVHWKSDTRIFVVFVVLLQHRLRISTLTTDTIVIELILPTCYTTRAKSYRCKPTWCCEIIQWEWRMLHNKVVIICDDHIIDIKKPIFQDHN
jgi:hypothetical protein